MIANNLEPFEPTHPGKLLKDELECCNISQKQLAMDMGVSYTVLNDIVRGKRPVDYDMLVTKRDKSFAERLANVRKIAAVL